MASPPWLVHRFTHTYQFLLCLQESAGYASRMYAKRASHASSTLIPSEPQVQVDVSRTGHVPPIPSHVINMTLPGNPEPYSNHSKKRLDSPPETPPRHRRYPSVA